MLILKLMNDQDLADDDASKGFMLFVCPHEVGFKQVDDIPYATFINHEAEIMDIEMHGNAYVMQNGKTIASYSYSDNHEKRKSCNDVPMSDNPPPPNIQASK